MQVLASNRASAGRPSRVGVVTAAGMGLALVAASAALLYLVFAQNFLDRFMPTGRRPTYEPVAGALAWTFPLTAPAGFRPIGLPRPRAGPPDDVPARAGPPRLAFRPHGAGGFRPQRHRPARHGRRSRTRTTASRHPRRPPPPRDR